MWAAARNLAPVLLAGGLLVALFLRGGVAADEEKVLNVYNLPDYIGEHTIADSAQINLDIVRPDVNQHNLKAATTCVQHHPQIILP